jgi:hypothetical protein
MFRATAHGKDLSDSENGACKNAADRHQIAADDTEVSKIKDPYEFYTFCEENLTLPYTHIFEKKGKAIFRIIFHWVPAVGVGSIDRRIPHLRSPLKTDIGGIKKMHHLCDIGEEGVGCMHSLGNPIAACVVGKLRVRVSSCHRCDACGRGEFGECKYFEFTGMPHIAALHINEAAAARTRSSLEQTADSMGQLVSIGDKVAVQLVNKSEPFLIAEIVCTCMQATCQAHKHWCCRWGQCM